LFTKNALKWAPGSVKVVSVDAFGGAQLRQEWVRRRLYAQDFTAGVTSLLKLTQQNRERSEPSERTHHRPTHPRHEGKRGRDWQELEQVAAKQSSVTSLNPSRKPLAALPRSTV
jgi:hypothetical protein